MQVFTEVESRRAWNFFPRFLFIAGLLLILTLTYLYSFVLFHTLAELGSIAIAFAIFVIVWNARSFLKNEFFLFLGISYLFVAGIDLVHTLTYKGISIVTPYDANLPTQFWIIGRYVQSISLLLASLLIGRRISVWLLLLIYSLITAFLLLSLALGIFPDCYIEGVGLTAFKTVSEYLISLIFLLAIGVLWRKRNRFQQTQVLYDVFASVAFAVISELIFTSYVNVYDFNNMLGHIFDVLSVYFIYMAFVETALRKPYSLLFSELKQNEIALQKYQYHLEQLIDIRTESLQKEIDNRLSMEAELKRSQSRLSSFSSALPDAAFVINREGICLEILTPGSAEVALDSSKMLGKSIYTRLPEKYIDNAKNIVHKAFETQQVQSMEYEKHVHGYSEWIEKRVAPVATVEGEAPLVICLERDITEARRENRLLQTRLVLSEYAVAHSVDELMRKTIDEAELLTNSPLGFLYLLESGDRKRPLQIYSSNTIAQLGANQGDAHHSALIQTEVWADCIRRQIPIIHNNHEMLPHNQDASENHIKLKRELLTPIIREDQVLAILYVANKPDDYGESDKEMLFWLANMAWDIIARKNAELQVRQREEIIALKDKFISTVSHEFRTPLAIIQTSIDLVTHYADRLSTERREQAFQRITEQVKSLTSLINDVLSISRTQTRRMEFNPAPVILNQFCRTVFEQTQFADTSNHEFEFSSDLSDVLMNVDATLLQHVLTNLLSNAVKYSPAGSLVSLNLYQKGKDIVMAVSDEGIGIPEEEQIYLFEPFYRASNVGETMGTGLGLSIIKEYIILHGGRIEIESTFNQGSIFRVFLPAQS